MTPSLFARYQYIGLSEPIALLTALVVGEYKCCTSCTPIYCNVTRDLMLEIKLNSKACTLHAFCVTGYKYLSTQADLPWSNARMSQLIPDDMMHQAALLWHITTLCHAFTFNKVLNKDARSNYECCFIPAGIDWQCLQCFVQHVSDTKDYVSSYHLYSNIPMQFHLQQ